MKIIDVVTLVVPIIIVGFIVYQVATYNPLSDQIKVTNILIERGACQQLDEFIKREGIADEIPNALDKCATHFQK